MFMKEDIHLAFSRRGELLHGVVKNSLTGFELKTLFCCLEFSQRWKASFPLKNLGFAIKGLIISFNRRENMPSLVLWIALRGRESPLFSNGKKIGELEFDLPEGKEQSYY